MRNITVYVSGSASTLDNLCNKIKDGSLHANISLVVSNNFKAIPIVEKHKLDFFKVIDPYDSNIFKRKELMVLAGWNFLVKIPEPAWAYKIMNIHPTLLPKYGGKGFYGMKPHEAVLATKEKESGCTVHWIDEFLDHGEIIAQKVVPVLESDTPKTLQERVKIAERELYPQVIEDFLNEINK